jgi:hypothetical protein
MTPMAHLRRISAIETPTAMPIVAPGERLALLIWGAELVVAAEVELELGDDVLV